MLDGLRQGLVRVSKYERRIGYAHERGLKAVVEIPADRIDTRLYDAAHLVSK